MQNPLILELMATTFVEDRRHEADQYFPPHVPLSTPAEVYKPRAGQPHAPAATPRPRRRRAPRPQGVRQREETS